MSPIEGPLGVMVSWNEQTAASIGQRAPFTMAKRIPWHGMRDAMIWHPLPLTTKLGLPLRYRKYLASGPCILHSSCYVNQTVGFLTVDIDPESDTFGQPQALIHEDVIISRADGEDLDGKQLETVEGFVRSELFPLLLYGASIGTQNDAACHEADLEEDGRSRSNSPSRPDPSQKSYSVGGDVTREQAVELIANINPMTFAAFFEQYRAKRATTFSDWRTAVNPIQPSECETCHAPEVENGSLFVCGGCQLVKYCERECQILAWDTHKPVCMAMRSKK